MTDEKLAKVLLDAIKTQQVVTPAAPVVAEKKDAFLESGKSIFVALLITFITAAGGVIWNIVQDSSKQEVSQTTLQTSYEKDIFTVLEKMEDNNLRQEKYETQMKESFEKMEHQMQARLDKMEKSMDDRFTGTRFEREMTPRDKQLNRLATNKSSGRTNRRP